MHNKLKILFLFILVSFGAGAQQPSNKGLRIADSLSSEEKRLNNRIILRNELDSLINEYVATLPKTEEKKSAPPVIVENDHAVLTGLSVLIIIMLGGFIYYYHRQQKKSGPDQENEPGNKTNTKETGKKSKTSVNALESKISDLKTELFRLTRENENLNIVIKEYNGIQREYDSLKHGLLRSYKIRNYPGYDKSKHETAAIQGVFNTEQSVSAYAYEKFLKPILAIADANKNSPARTSTADKEKILDLLVSLSLLYIEYLYLRVNELAIGGKMVERIQGFEKGNGIDASLLKKLDTEFGSRALVIKLALKEAGLNQLVYPVFDETNLNN